jgi:hypothetical protein
MIFLNYLKIYLLIFLNRKENKRKKPKTLNLTGHFGPSGPSAAASLFPPPHLSPTSGAHPGPLSFVSLPCTAEPRCAPRLRLDVRASPFPRTGNRPRCFPLSPSPTSLSFKPVMAELLAAAIDGVHGRPSISLPARLSLSSPLYKTRPSSHLSPYPSSLPHSSCSLTLTETPTA